MLNLGPRSLLGSFFWLALDIFPGHFLTISIQERHFGKHIAKQKNFFFNM